MNTKEQRTVTTTIASKGAESVLKQESKDKAFAWTEGNPRTSYSAGKTISLGDFQFARVAVTVEVEHSDDDVNAAFDTTRFIAKEITDQEAASVKGEDREQSDFYTGDFSKWRVSIDYGLTLKTGKYDSAKVDISMTRYTERASLGDTVSEMRKELAQRIMAESREIKA